eukprot:264905_1
MMSFSCINDIWSTQTIGNNDNNDDSKDNIVTLVNNCVLKLNKSLVLSRNNVFAKIIFEPFDADKVNSILRQHISKHFSLIEEDQIGLSHMDDEKKSDINIVLQNQLNLNKIQKKKFIKIIINQLNRFITQLQIHKQKKK